MMGNPYHRVPYDRILSNLVEQSVAVEQAGFDCVWLGEHHFGGEGMDIIPNPITIHSHLAARTSKIRLGLAAVIVTQWHPLRVVEEIALLDQISGGRVECGVGRGIYTREAMNLNPDADRRDEDRNWRLFRETVQIMQKAWTEDPFTWEEEFYRYPHPEVPDSHRWYTDSQWRSESGEYTGMSIQPKPFQKPYPPMWNVVDKPPGFVVAEELGLKPITWLRAREGLRKAFTTYQEAASRIQGRQLALGEDCALMRTTFVAETMDEARRIAEPALNQRCSYVGGVRARSIYIDPDETLTDEANSQSWVDFLMERDHILIGEPEFVAEKINHLNTDFGLDNLLTFVTLLSLDHEHVMRSIQLFAEWVVPLVKEKQAVRG